MASARNCGAAKSSTAKLVARASPYKSAYTCKLRDQCALVRPPFTAKLPASLSRCQITSISSSATSTLGPTVSGLSMTWSRTARLKSSRLSCKLRDARTSPRTSAAQASGRSRTNSSVTDMTPCGCVGANGKISSKPNSLHNVSGCCLERTIASSTRTRLQSASPLKSCSMRCGGGPATIHSTSPADMPTPFAMSCASVWLNAPKPSMAQRLPFSSEGLVIRSFLATKFWARAWAIDARIVSGLPSRRLLTQGTQVP
mmetsp:Transcript_31542/g.86904  ORF Transcript_31542/g.86904 Transcript_31542/m.86904 type:complete len:257 (+) Transcript_31542:156-926(+)